MTNTRLAIETLRHAGILHPLRMVRFIQKSIKFLNLDLSGFTVLTEAASGPYVVTPIIAALANADRVLALTQNSQYASVEAVFDQTRALETLCGTEERVEILTDRNLEIFSKADIVTNLGFVRPIDAEIVESLKPTAVIPLMCETWEFRPGDVDLIACQRKGIPVVGTNEDYPGLKIFNYCGWVCIKILLDAQIEMHRCKVIVLSSDKFGTVITKQLVQSGIKVHLLSSLRGLSMKQWAEADALIVADYTRQGYIIGLNGDITAEEILRFAPYITIIQFAGRVDVEGLRSCGLVVYPNYEVGAHRMAYTLATLNPRPVIELHAAGLKVGQLVIEKSKCSHLSSYDRSRYRGLCLPINSDVIKKRKNENGQ